MMSFVVSPSSSSASYKSFCHKLSPFQSSAAFSFLGLRHGFTISGLGTFGAGWLWWRVCLFHRQILVTESPRHPPLVWLQCPQMSPAVPWGVRALLLRTTWLHMPSRTPWMSRCMTWPSQCLAQHLYPSYLPRQLPGNHPAQSQENIQGTSCEVIFCPL